MVSYAPSVTKFPNLDFLLFSSNGSPQASQTKSQAFVLLGVFASDEAQPGQDTLRCTHASVRTRASCEALVYCMSSLAKVFVRHAKLGRGAEPPPPTVDGYLINPQEVPHLSDTPSPASQNLFYFFGTRSGHRHFPQPKRTSPVTRTTIVAPWARAPPAPTPAPSRAKVQLRHLHSRALRFASGRAPCSRATLAPPPRKQCRRCSNR